MYLDYLVNLDGKIINTCTNTEINPKYTFEIERIERKNNVKLLTSIITDNTFYKYDVKVCEYTIKLTVYKSFYNYAFDWTPIYTVQATFGQKGIKEEGDCDLNFWHEYFATCYGTKPYNEFNVNLFSLTDKPMKVLRKIFTTHLENNIFLFLEKYKDLKKINDKIYDTKIFENIPASKIHNKVGKILDNTKNDSRWRNYAFQKEIVINNDVFFDITVITGPVFNGIMDIKEKHRFFITDGFAYSPDDGDLEVFVSGNFYGKIYDKLMQKRYPMLMLEKYRSNKYYYAYLLSRNFLPAFEILAKAGYETLANLCLDYYFYNFDLFETKGTYSEYNIYGDKINFYGKNDKEILGFKLSKLKNLDEGCYNTYKDTKSAFFEFVSKIRNIVKNCPSILDAKCNPDILDYANYRRNSKTLIKEIRYLKAIGFDKAEIYKDYLRLCEQANKYSGGLFPKNLASCHDTMVTYTNQLREAKNNKVFEKTVSTPEYKELIYNGEEYCILAPRVANDLVNESYQLSHCVRGYISDVARGYTRIYFMRKVEKKSTPFITLEVRDNYVRQARGKANRPLTTEEEKFVDEWIAKKGLSNSLYKY